MARYRRKPIEVEAVQFDGSRESAERIIKGHGYVMQIVEDDGPLAIAVNTGVSTGLAYVLAGEWIVTERPSARYRIYGDREFAQLFEPVD